MESINFHTIRINPLRSSRRPRIHPALHIPLVTKQWLSDKTLESGKQHNQNTTYRTQKHYSTNQHNFKKSILTRKSQCKSSTFFLHVGCGMEGANIWIYGCLWNGPISYPCGDDLLAEWAHFNLAAAQSSTTKGPHMLEIWGWLISKGFAKPQALLAEVVLFGEVFDLLKDLVTTGPRTQLTPTPNHIRPRTTTGTCAGKPHWKVKSARQQVVCKGVWGYDNGSLPRACFNQGIMRYTTARWSPSLR